MPVDPVKEAWPMCLSDLVKEAWPLTLKGNIFSNESQTAWD